MTAKDYKRITGGELSEHAPKYALSPMIVTGELLERLKALKLSKRYFVVFVTREQLTRIVEGARGALDYFQCFYINYSPKYGIYFDNSLSGEAFGHCKRMYLKKYC